MKENSISRPWCIRALVALLVVAAFVKPAPAALNIFSTGFEPPEYDAGFALVGQDGWISEGSGGNGLLVDKFPGQGQQAYIGNFAPALGYDYLLAWKSINFDAVASGYPVVQFTTQMSIEDSVNGEYDNFEWIVFNSNAERLLTIDFDNYFLDVSYRLDGTNAWVYSVAAFTNSVIYNLTVTMDFQANLWSATLNNTPIATGQPLTTTGLPLNLGDIDALWGVFDIDAPGDNYMVFDNYTITGISAGPQMRLLERAPNGDVSLRALGEEGTQIAIEASTNLINWVALITNTILPGNYYDYTDTSAASLPRRFYRGRLVP